MQPLYLSDWLAWHADDAQCMTNSRHSSPTPPGETLPAMLRRRLDNIGRATCDIFAELAPEDSCPLIHASRHGDVSHTLDMLHTLATGDPLSPTRFSMSVHNATLGVYSIAHRHHFPLQSLGACGYEFDALLHEAAGYLADGHDTVVAVLSEGELPAIYQEHTSHPGQPCAIGLRLTHSEGRRLSAEDTRTPGEPTPLTIRAWLEGERAWLDGQRRWHLESG